MDFRIRNILCKMNSIIIDEKKVLICILLLLVPIFILPQGINSIIIPRFYLITFISFLCLIDIIYHWNIVITKKKLYYMLAVFLFCAAIASIFANDKTDSWLGLCKLVAFSAKNGAKPILFIANVYYYTGFITYLMCAVLFILATCIDGTKSLLKYIILSTSLVSIAAVLQFFSIDIVPWNEIANPVSGTMGNPNFLASLMVFVIPASIMSYIFTNKLIWLLSSGLIFAGLLVSNTRGAWLTFLGVLAIIIFYVYKSEIQNKLKKILKLFLILILVLAVLLPANGGALLRRSSSISGEISSSLKLKDEGGSYRVYIYKEVIKVIKKNWLVGVGPDNLIYEKIVTPNGSVTAKAHSNILEIAATMGIPSLIAYLAFIISIFRRYKKGNKAQFVYLLMSFSYMVQGLVNIDMIMIYPLFWIVLGLSAAAGEEGSAPEVNIKIQNTIMEECNGQI